MYESWVIVLWPSDLILSYFNCFSTCFLQTFITSLVSLHHASHNISDIFALKHFYKIKLDSNSNVIFITQTNSTIHSNSILITTLCEQCLYMYSYISSLIQITTCNTCADCFVTPATLSIPRSVSRDVFRSYQTLKCNTNTLMHAAPVGKRRGII